MPDVGVWTWLAAHPATIAGRALVAAASALLPVARRSSRFGVAAIGFVLVAASVLAGAGVASTFVCRQRGRLRVFRPVLLRRVA